MSTITTINASDLITDSRTVINANFSALNTDKIETDVIDTDTALAADSDAKLPSQKAVKAYVDSKLVSSLLEVETTAGATHSLTTNGTQKVIVWATGNTNGSSADKVVLLNYNSVEKCRVISDGNGQYPFSLIYTETPGSATQDITVTTSSGSLENVKIVVLKIETAL